jgi:TRAP transporter 4TM/12TM fusion protein
MKRLGYRPEFAAAVESTASTGGQIMPPIMGAGAFLMAEMLGIPYTKVIIAAAIPAVLYFFGVGVGIYMEALKLDYPRVPKDMMPNPRELLTWGKLGPLVVSIAMLLVVLFSGYTPQYACFSALITLVILYLFTTGRIRDITERLRLLIIGVAEGARTLIGVAVLVICVQVIINLVGLTGVAIKVSEFIISASGGSLIVAMILGGATAMALGMGIPTTAAYIIGVTVLGRAMIQLGLEPLNAHMFIFYFAIISAITPPVCSAVYIAAAMTETKWLNTGFVAVRLGLAAYIVPFMFALNPVLLMRGSVGDILLGGITALVGVTALGMGAMGYFIKNASILERVLLIAAAFCLIQPVITTDLIGVGLIAITWLIQRCVGTRKTVLRKV